MIKELLVLIFVIVIPSALVFGGIVAIMEYEFTGRWPWSKK